MNDLKTHILDIAQRNPNMRAYRIAQEIKKFETNKHLAEEDYRLQLARNQQNMAAHYPSIQLVVSPPRRNWLERFASYFSPRGM
jgi:hypothetical protein